MSCHVMSCHVMSCHVMSGTTRSRSSGRGRGAWLRRELSMRSRWCHGPSCHSCAQCRVQTERTIVLYVLLWPCVRHDKYNQTIIKPTCHAQSCLDEEEWQYEEAEGVCGGQWTSSNCTLLTSKNHAPVGIVHPILYSLFLYIWNEYEMWECSTYLATGFPNHSSPAKI